MPPIVTSLKAIPSPSSLITPMCEVGLKITDIVKITLNLKVQLKDTAYMSSLDKNVARLSSYKEGEGSGQLASDPAALQAMALVDGDGSIEGEGLGFDPGADLAGDVRGVDRRGGKKFAPFLPLRKVAAVTARNFAGHVAK